MTSPILTTADAAKPLPLWLTAEEVGALAGISVKGVQREVYFTHRLVRAGKPHIRRSYKLADVLRWLDSRGQLEDRWRPYMEVGNE